jgi:hypothetical protein
VKTFGRRTLLVAVVLGCAVLIALAFRPASGERPPAPADGTVDLSAWDFSRSPSVTVAGTWLYFDRVWSEQATASGRRPLDAIVPGPWPVLENWPRWSSI